MKGNIKAALIFSILPQHIKSICITRFTYEEYSKLNDGLQQIPYLRKAQHTAILRQFITQMQAIAINRQRIFDISIITSFALWVIIASISFMIAHGSFSQGISNFNYIIQFGGFHTILLPFVIIYAQDLLNKAWYIIIKPSSHILYDITMACIAASAILMLFIFTTPSVVVAQTPVTRVAFVLSITAVPLLEELFFRGILFLYGGKKYGFAITWLASSFCFSCIHLPYTPLLFAAYFATSSILCFLAYRFSLFSSIFAHALSNILIFLY